MGKTRERSNITVYDQTECISMLYCIPPMFQVNEARLCIMHGKALRGTYKGRMNDSRPSSMRKMRERSNVAVYDQTECISMFTVYRQCSRLTKPGRCINNNNSRLGKTRRSASLRN